MLYTIWDLFFDVLKSFVVCPVQNLICSVSFFTAVLEIQCSSHASFRRYNAIFKIINTQQIIRLREEGQTAKQESHQRLRGCKQSGEEMTSYKVDLNFFFVNNLVFASPLLNYCHHLYFRWVYWETIENCDLNLGESERELQGSGMQFETLKMLIFIWW